MKAVKQNRGGKRLLKRQQHIRALSLMLVVSILSSITLLSRVNVSAAANDKNQVIDAGKLTYYFSDGSTEKKRSAG